MAKRILIVEDNLDLHGMFRHALVLAGFDVLHATDGLAALRSIETAPPDVVVLDLGLPTMSGADVRQEMADRPHTKDIPVIVITGRPLDARDLDVVCVLRKPVSASRLVAEVFNAVMKGGAGSQR